MFGQRVAFPERVLTVGEKGHDLSVDGELRQFSDATERIEKGLLEPQAEFHMDSGDRRDIDVRRHVGAIVRDRSNNTLPERLFWPFSDPPINAM